MLGHSTQSILDLCELMGANLQAIPEPSFTLNPSNQPSPIFTQKRQPKPAPKSKRLTANLIYDFDIYVRAAVEIQKVYRGFKCRKFTLRCVSFAKFRQKIISI